jgi:hypothetical protein
VPASDVDTVAVDSLKALDPDRPIREADIPRRNLNVRFGPGGDIALAQSVKAGPSRFQALPAKTPALDHATTPDPWIGGVGLLAKVG